MEYLSRIVDELIEKKLKIMGSVVIKGPKWCGKTTSAKRYANSILELQNPETREKNIALSKNDISMLLDGDKPRLIDEWQVIPNIWNAVRHDIDQKNQQGLYLLTGSATPIDDDDLHSGTGRMAFVSMKPMTLFESGESNGKISLKDIRDGVAVVKGQTANISYQDLAYLTCRGGWPGAMNLDKELALEIPLEYINALCEKDISKVDGKTRNPMLARQILKAYARLTSTIESDATILKDLELSGDEISKNTYYDYMKVLKRLYVIDEIDAWNPNLRSKTATRTSPKKGFVDPSIACAVLECSPKELAADPNTFGLMFENLVARDLSVYVEKIGGYLRHYRDRYGLECDHVIHFNNGKFGLIQTKLGYGNVDQGIEKLRELRDLIEDKNKSKRAVKKPDFLMVITDGDTAFTTEDGILVVPIGCLKD